MKIDLSGIPFSLLVLIGFISFRAVLGLWPAFACSLFMTIPVFVLYCRKKNWNRKKTVLISFSTSLFFILFASVGITLFPPHLIRDLGDIIMPYLNACAFGVCIMVVLFLSGVVFTKG